MHERVLTGKSSVRAVRLGGSSEHRTESTLLIMSELVRAGAHDPKIRQQALDITADCGGHDFKCQIDALFYHVRDGVTFRRDPVGAEWVQDALWTAGLRQGVSGWAGDCDDKVVYLGSLLGSIGHRTRFKIYSSAGTDWDHIAIQVLYQSVTGGGGRWIALDPTGESMRPGDEVTATATDTWAIWDKPRGLGQDGFAPGFTNPESSLPSLFPQGKPTPGMLLPGIDYVPGQDFIGVPTAPVINPVTGLIEPGAGYIGPSPIESIVGYSHLNPTVGPYATGTGAVSSQATGFQAALQALLGVRSSSVPVSSISSPGAGPSSGGGLSPVWLFAALGLLLLVK